MSDRHFYEPEKSDVFASLVGKTITSIVKVNASERINQENDIILFFTEEDKVNVVSMGHRQDCCEHVWIEDITGDLKDLIGTPVVVAEERTVDLAPESDDGLQTATFYCIRTNKGSVDIRWNGASNGYYSTFTDVSTSKRSLFSGLVDVHDKCITLPDKDSNIMMHGYHDVTEFHHRYYSTGD